MALEISSALVARLLDDAAKVPDREICGLLFGPPCCIASAQPCANVAADPGDSFEIDPAALFAAHRAARAGGPPLIGFYHSHPTGLPIASARDHAASTGDGMVWLILGNGCVGGWRATLPQLLTPIELNITEVLGSTPPPTQ